MRCVNSAETTSWPESGRIPCTDPTTSSARRHARPPSAKAIAARFGVATATEDLAPALAALGCYARQDEAIRAPGRGVTEITGGPGTGKTVVALHRAAYLLYNERRRYEGGGVLVIGPSSAYTAYIERVLPSLGEDSVTLRSLGDVVDAITTGRLDRPEVAAIKGTLRVRRLLERVASDRVPGAPDGFRAFVGGQAITIAPAQLDDIRRRVLRGHQRNSGAASARGMLAEAAWATHRAGERADFFESFEQSMAVDDFMERWWPQVDPREVLLWLADTDLAYRHGAPNLDGWACVFHR